MNIIDIGLMGNQHRGRNEMIRLWLEENRETLLNGETNNGICYDGIIDEDAYKQSSTRVMVLMKETNGNDKKGNRRAEQKDWDYLYWLKHQQVEDEPLIEFDENGKKTETKNVFYAPTFRKLCQWLTILFEISEDKDVSVEDFFVDGKIDVSSARKSLNKVALVNLKKSWGYEKTDFKKLCKYATNDKIRPIILKEIKMINPQIVLCCSPDVYYIAAKMFGVDTKDHIRTKSQVLKNKINEMFVKNDTIYVSFYHPQGYSHTDEEFAQYAIEVFNWVFEQKKVLKK